MTVVQRSWNRHRRSREGDVLAAPVHAPEVLALLLDASAEMRG